MSGHDAAPAVPAPPRRPRRTALWTSVAVGVVVVLLVGVLATRPPASSAIAASPLVGKPAPEVAGPDLDGRPVRLSGMRGTWVVVNFFATWCVPCVREHPELVRFTERHPGGEARVLAVIYDDDRGEVRRFFRENGGDWPVVDDADSKVDFGVRGVPESFLVDPDGFVVTRLVGGVTAAGLEAVLRRAAGGG